ncbi:TPA: DNA mismatch repair protein MutT [Streptococcus suis]|nr:DNA mismatch repair protein MutT [Streptococcus suis]
MSRKQLVTLTNMCMIEDKDGNVVVQIRDPKRYRWSGAALPGGDGVIIMTGA